MISYNCNQRGHIKAQCRNPRRGNGQQGGQGTSNRPQRNQRGNQGQRRQRRRTQPRAQANFSEAVEAEAFVIEASHMGANSASIKDEFVVDSGTNFHVTQSKAHMINYMPYQRKREIRLGGQRTLSAHGSGTAVLTFMSDGQPITVTLEGVLYVPNLRRNLISVTKLADDGFEFSVKSD